MMARLPHSIVERQDALGWSNRPRRPTPAGYLPSGSPRMGCGATAPRSAASEDILDAALKEISPSRRPNGSARQPVLLVGLEMAARHTELHEATRRARSTHAWSARRPPPPPQPSAASADMMSRLPRQRVLCY